MPEREKIPTLCQEWLEHATAAYETLEIAFQPDTFGYKRPLFPRFWDITQRLVEWCRDEADEIDGGPLDELACELLDPLHAPMRSAELRKLWSACKDIVKRIGRQADQGQTQNEAGNGHKKRPIRRRPGTVKKLRRLTIPQTEAVQIVGECKGNIAEAARRLGKNRKTVEEAYKAGLKKLGKQAVRSRDKTRLFARDRRGQDCISEDDDRRL
jgi:hypothetical protein